MYHTDHMIKKSRIHTKNFYIYKNVHNHMKTQLFFHNDSAMLLFNGNSAEYFSSL